MKKILIFSILFCIVCLSFSQNDFRFGMILTPQLTWLQPDIKNVESNKVRFGYNAGLLFDYFIGKNYAFESGLSISGAGGELKYLDSIYFYHDDNIKDTLDKNAIITYKLQYVNIPIGLKFATNEIGYITYYGRLGLLSQLNVKAVGDATQKNIKDSKINKEVTPVNFSYYFGGGIHYSLTESTALLVGVTYNNGFFDITTEKAGRKKDKVALHSIMLDLGILF